MIVAFVLLAIVALGGDVLGALLDDIGLIARAPQLGRRPGDRGEAFLRTLIAAGEGKHRPAHRQHREQEENDDH